MARFLFSSPAKKRAGGEDSPEQRQRWSEGSVTSWVNEGHEIAAHTIYGELPYTGKLPDDYETKALPIVNEQLERAGVRLAVILNSCLQ